MLEKRILSYQTLDGKVPFRDWLFGNDLDNISRNIILERLHRLSLGNPGYWGPVGNGVFELKIDFGPGYRIYYAISGRDVVLLLCGGSKSSQKKDINLALKYWADFKRRNKW